MRKLTVAVVAACAVASAAPAAELELWRLDCGTIRVRDLDAFSDIFAYPGMQKDLTESCYLIRHDRELMLWDTGLPKSLLGAAFGTDVMSPTLSRTLVEQLAEIKVAPGDIGRVGISHYHFDHTGQAADFPQATLLIGRADLEALKAAAPPSGADPTALKPWLAGGAKVDPVDGDRDVFGDGSVRMLAMPGHTPGSLALLVELASGPVLLSGDVVHFQAQLPHNGVPPFNTNRADSLASIDRLKGIITATGAKLVIQHDADDIGALPAFPESAR
jgi:glyoxylase-like metal-dependent hydrolase (beta-lactamase superfamily II)